MAELWGLLGNKVLDLSGLEGLEALLSHSLDFPPVWDLEHPIHCLTCFSLQHWVKGVVLS